MNATNYLTSTSMIERLVDQMIINQGLSWTRDHQAAMDPVQFRHEFQTINLSLPRRSGHTSAALSMWVKYNAILIHPTFLRYEHFIRHNLRHVPTATLNPREPSNFRCFVPNQHHDNVVSRYQVFVERIHREGVDLPELLVFDGSDHKLPNYRSEDVIELITQSTFRVLKDTIKGVVVLQ